MKNSTNIITNLITSTCLQMTQTIIMKVIINKFFPIIAKLLKFLTCYGFIKIFIYLLCSCVLFYILYKLYNIYKKIKSNSSSSSGSSKSSSSSEPSKPSKPSNKLQNVFKKKNIKKNILIPSIELSPIPSSSNDFVLEPKKNNKKKTTHKNTNKHLKSESLLSSSF